MSRSSNTPKAVPPKRTSAPASAVGSPTHASRPVSPVDSPAMLSTNSQDSKWAGTRWLIVTVVGGVVFGAAVIATLFAWMTPRPTLSVESLANSDQGTARLAPLRKKPEERPVELQTKKDDQPTIKPLDVKPIEVAVVPMPKSTEPPKVVVIPERPLPPAFSDIAAKGRQFSLPKRDGGLSAISSTPGELCKIFVKDAVECGLKLNSAEIVDGQPRLSLQLDKKAPKGTQSWIVNARGAKGILDGESPMVAIGIFRLSGQSLMFEWVLASPTWSLPHGLTYCTLDVTVSGETVTCKLINSQRRKPERFNLAQGNRPISLDVPPMSLQTLAVLKLDLELQFGDWSAQETLSAVNNPATRIVIPKTSSHGEGNVDLEVRLLLPSDGQAASLKYDVFPRITFLKLIEAKGPKELPHWEHSTARTDEFKPIGGVDRPTKEGFIIPSFQRLQRSVSVQKKTATEGPIKDANAKVNSLKKQIGFLESESDTAKKSQVPEKMKKTGEELQRAKSELDYWEGMKNHWQELVKYDKDFSEWIAEMKTHFEDLQMNLEVRFSVYLEFGDERVVLSSTEPPPQRTEGKSNGIAPKVSGF